MIDTFAESGVSLPIESARFIHPIQACGKALGHVVYNRTPRLRDRPPGLCVRGMPTKSGCYGDQVRRAEGRYCLGLSLRECGARLAGKQERGVRQLDDARTHDPWGDPAVTCPTVSWARLASLASTRCAWDCLIRCAEVKRCLSEPAEDSYPSSVTACLVLAFLQRAKSRRDIARPIKAIYMRVSQADNSLSGDARS